MKFMILLSTILSASAYADSISRGTVEKKLHQDFSGADRIVMTQMKENYWGLYRNYQVSFKAQFPDGVYQVSCDMDAPRATDLRFHDCSATDKRGGAVDVAKYYTGKADQRLPASR